MRNVLIVFFAIVVSPCFSQVDEFFNDFKSTSEIDYQRFDSMQQIQKRTLKAIKNSLPDKRKMPLLSDAEFLSSVKNIKGFLKDHTPRIFEYAFEYKNYIIIHYHLKIGPSRMPLIAVARMNPKNKVDLLVFMRRWDFSSVDKFHSLKRINKRTYFEEAPNRSLSILN